MTTFGTITGTSCSTRTTYEDGSFTITVPPETPCPDCGDVHSPDPSLYLCGGCGALRDGVPPLIIEPRQEDE